MSAPVWLWPTLLAGLGAIVGSFVAVIVVRWPQGRSATRGRSACDACGRTVRAYDLVPVVSFVVRRGRCRDCGGRINPMHPAIEVMAAAIGLVAGIAAPGVAGVAGAAFGWLLLTLGALDLAAWWLPDRLVAALAVVGLVAGAAGLPPAIDERLIGGGAGLAGLWLIAHAYRRLRGRDGMGGGDPKLLGAIGLWLGWRALPAILLVACLIGLGVVGWRLLSGRRVDGGDAMPLGTLLALAAYPAWLIVIAGAA